MTSSPRQSGWVPLALLGLGLVTACSDGEPVAPAEETESPALLEEVRETDAPPLSTLESSAPSIAVCGKSARYEIWAGLHFPGTVTVSNDARNLHVTYAIDDDERDWFLSEAWLSVTRTVGSIPLSSKRLPNSWAFPYSQVLVPSVKTHTFSIPLAENGWRAGDRLVVAAASGLVKPKKSGDWEGKWEWMVAWGIGNISGRTLDDLANYTVQACPDAPPPPPPASKGVITITFDDGHESTYLRAFPILKEHGLRANAALNPLPIDSLWRSYLRLEQVKELDEAGWAIVSHSMTHRRLKDLTDAELEWELVESRRWIEKHGFRGSHVFVVPFHSWGARERAAIQRHYAAARGYSANQFTPIRMVKYPIGKPYELTAFEPEFAPYSTAAGRAITRSYLEKAVEEGEFVDIFFHNIRETDVAAFRELVQILAEFEPYIKTYDEIIPR